MLNRYKLTLEQPHKYEAGWRPVHTRSFKTLDSAKRAAIRLLDRHPNEVTRGGRRPRSWTSTISDARTGWTIMHIDAPEVLVPSVGELGYW